MMRSSIRVTASWDTQTNTRLPYNPNAPKKNCVSPLFKPKPPVAFIASTPESPSRVTPPQSITDLLKFKNKTVSLPAVDESYLGLETWLPSPPKVEKPRSVYNASQLAYIGDSIFELFARRHFLFPPMSVEDSNDRVMAVVRCEAQDALLQQLINENFLSPEERDILRWGKNVSSAKTRTKKRAGVAVYNRASSLETLVGYLYLTNPKRLEEIMEKIGFSVGCSATKILED